MSELQATPSYKTLPVFDEEPTPHQIRMLGLRPWSFDEHEQLVCMGRDAALYLKDKKPGNVLDSESYPEVKRLAQYGPTGYIYEVGVGDEPRRYYAGPMINRCAGGYNLHAPWNLPGHCGEAILQMESGYGEHRYLLLDRYKTVYFNLAEWNLVAVSALFAPALVRMAAKDIDIDEGWPEGSIGHALHPDRFK